MTSQNGTLKARKPQLADSIEKLDEMVDGLATAIPGAVADSVREALGPAFAAAIKDAVKAAVAEALADIQVGRDAKPALVPPVPPAAPPAPVAEKPSRWARVKAALGRVRRWLANKAAPVVARLALGWAVTRMIAGATARSRPAAVVTAVTGTTAGVGGYLLGPVGAAVLLGLAAASLAASAAFAAPAVRLLAAFRDDTV
jgi:hypothetical protein